MTLKFKRNLPLLIALMSLLTVLVLIVGNQPIVSYTVNPNDVVTDDAMYVFANAETDEPNGAIDYNGTFNLTIGYPVAIGSSGIAEAPNVSSTQYSVLYYFDAPQAAHPPL
jgi:hypothetical protein